MKKIILIALILLQTGLFAQTSSISIVNTKLKLNTVSQGVSSDSLLVRGADKVVKFVKQSEIGVKFIKSNENLSFAKRKGDVLYGILDKYTGEEITLSKITTTPTVDGIVYFQLGAEYFKRNYTVFNALWYGVKNDNTNTQARIDALMASDIKVIRFPSGIYQSYMNNTTSNRTFIFDEGAVIDGVVHLAVGSGPDVGAQPVITWVNNVRVIGTLISTVRVGMYYCNGVNIDKIRITEANSLYVNQTIEGGAKGVHIYLASKNINIGEVIVESTIAAGYGFGIDLSTTNDANHIPENIHVGKLTVKSTNQIALNIAGSKSVSIDEAYLNWTGSTFGVALYNNLDLKFGKLFVNGTGSTGAGAGVYNFSSNTYIEQVITHHCSGIGMYVYGGDVHIQKLESYNNGMDGLRILSKCFIENVKTYSNTQKGINIMSGYTADKTVIQVAESYSNTADNIFVDGVSDVEIGSIIAYSSPTWGLFLNNTVRFKNQYLRAYSNLQGLRYIGNTDAYFGQMYLSGNTNNDIALSGTLSGFSVISASYTSISGGVLEDIVKYKTLPRGLLGAFAQGDNSVTLVVNSSYTTQRFGTALTANRLITLSTTGAKNGDKFKIVRNIGATGAFSLDVGGIKTLLSGQWCEVEYQGTLWVLISSGNLSEVANIASPIFTGTVTSPSYVKSGGTASQFLKADGSVDSNTYITTTTDPRPYKVYTAVITQSGTSAPTATVLENTLGGMPVWTRFSTGVFRATLTGAFTMGKTTLFVTPTTVGTGIIISSINNDVNTAQIAVYDSTSLVDGFLSSSSVEIRVYN